MVSATITKIVDNGPPEDKIDILIMGDGFTSSTTDTKRFDTKVQEFVNKFFDISPYKEMKTLFNVYKAVVESKESGIDRPEDGVTKDTALNTSYGTGGFVRLITPNDGGKAIQDVCNQAPGDYSEGGQDYGAVVVLINDTEYGGGGGGGIACVSVGQDGTYDYLGLADMSAHELAHSLGLLGDEYEVDGYKSHTGPEPEAPNLTVETQRSLIKWKRFINNTTAIPTFSKNGNCNKPNQNPTSGPIDVVGLFEGGGFWACGIYRPEDGCKMRDLNLPFCTVCIKTLLDTAINRETRCFIATAAFGSPLEPHVEFLRGFRDDIILKSRFKRLFESILVGYYIFSPPIAKKMGENQMLKNLLKYGIVYPFIYIAKLIVYSTNRLEEFFR